MAAWVIYRDGKDLVPSTISKAPVNYLAGTECKNPPRGPEKKAQSYLSVNKRASYYWSRQDPFIYVLPILLLLPNPYLIPQESSNDRRLHPYLRNFRLILSPILPLHLRSL